MRLANVMANLEMSKTDNPPGSLSIGHLVLVVGPSAVGKDTIMRLAAALVAGDDVIFPKREITRPLESAREDHIPIERAEFDRRVAEDGYLFHWGAHQDFYGIPRSAKTKLEDGKTVVVNVSRTIINEARAGPYPVRIAAITADPEVVAKRLRSRCGMSEEEVQERLSGISAFALGGEDVTVIENNGSPGEAAQALASVIQHLPELKAGCAAPLP